MRSKNKNSFLMRQLKILRNGGLKNNKNIINLFLKYDNLIKHV